MYISDSDVIVTGILSVMETGCDARAVEAQTINALMQLSQKFQSIPPEKLAQALHVISQSSAKAVLGYVQQTRPV
jgi:hypothetical protein